MAALLLLLIVVVYLVTFSAPGIQTSLSAKTFDFFCSEMSGMMRVGTGFYLLILTAYVLGLEYQMGTIRVLLVRGVGRLQLLLAKLTAIALVALLLLAGTLLVNALFLLCSLLLVKGNLSLLAGAGPHLALYVLTIVISMVATVLMATAVTALGRSLAFGLAAAIAFFPLDNFGTLMLYFASRLSHMDFWQQTTAYLLEPNLNQMNAALTAQPGWGFGQGPLAGVDGTHTLLVALIYTLIFAFVAAVLTSKRDVQE